MPLALGGALRLVTEKYVPASISYDSQRPLCLAHCFHHQALAHNGGCRRVDGRQQSMLGESWCSQQSALGSAPGLTLSGSVTQAGAFTL